MLRALHCPCMFPSFSLVPRYIWVELHCVSRTIRSQGTGEPGKNSMCRQRKKGLTSGGQYGSYQSVMCLGELGWQALTSLSRTKAHPT